MTRILFLLAAILLFSASAHAKIVTREVPYKDGDTELMGYYAYDDEKEKPLPGVIVVHEWWGHNDYARKRAEDLAALGYAAFAIDMYGKGVIADTPAKATELSKPFYDDREFMKKRAKAGLAALRAQPEVDITRLAAIGYCFGGTVALEIARGGEDLKGVVSFHGGLTTPAPATLGVVRARVLALNGKADPMSPPADREALKKEMTDAGVNFDSVDYDDATHAFTNPKATEIGKKFNLPVAYNAKADQDSFAKMKQFLADAFGK